ERLRELECALDVLARGFEVALTAVAARAVGEDVRPEEIARQAGSLGDRIRLVEESDRGRIARKLVAADAEAEENLGPVEVGERLLAAGRFSRRRAAQGP